MTGEQQPRRLPLHIEPIDGSAPWTPPFIPKDRPAEERLWLVREVLDRNVGILSYCFSPTDPSERRVFRGQGSGFLIKDNNEYFVVTAQHCLNYNFGLPESEKTPVITTERKLVIPNGGSPLEVQGDARYFFKPLEHRGRLEDIGIMRVESPDAAQLEGRGLEIMSPDEFRSASDDGMVYYAGYPGVHDGVLQIRTIMGQGYRTQEDVRGSSGGPMFAIMDGKIKVISLMTKVNYTINPGGELTDGKLKNEPDNVFCEIVHGLIADVRKG